MKIPESRQSARFTFFYASIVLLFISTGCSKASDDNFSYTGGTGGTNEVMIQKSTFNPSTLTVPVNTIVTWTNNDTYAHTVTSDSTMFDSGNMESNATFNFQFNKKGNYKYHCSYHYMMTGVIIVQ